MVAVSLKKINKFDWLGREIRRKWSLEQQWSLGLEEVVNSEKKTPLISWRDKSNRYPLNQPATCGTTAPNKRYYRKGSRYYRGDPRYYRSNGRS